MSLLVPSRVPSRMSGRKCLGLIFLSCADARHRGRKVAKGHNIKEKKAPDGESARGLLDASIAESSSKDFSDAF